MDTQTNTTTLPSCPRSAAGERLQAEVNKINLLMTHAESLLEHLRRQFLDACAKANAQDRADHRVLLGAPARMLLDADDTDIANGGLGIMTDAERDVCHIIAESIARAERKCQAVYFDPEEQREIDALFTKFAAAIECGPEYPSYSRTDGDPGEADFTKMIGLMQEANKEGGKE